MDIEMMQLGERKKILAIGAHADDVELGCGGTLSKLSRAGHSISIFVVSDSEYRAPDGRLIRGADIASAEARRSAKSLNAELRIGKSRAMHIEESDALNMEFLDIIEGVGPDIVFTHWTGDSHPDHRAVARTSLHISRHLPTVLCYASNLYLSDKSFDGRLFVDISENLDDKIKLIEIFESENKRTEGEWTRHADDLAAIYGRIAGVSRAEAFLVHKCLMKF